MAEENPVEYLRQLGKNFAGWRRYHLYSQADLVRKAKEKDGFFSESILSKFENGTLASYVQAAADLMGVDPKELLNEPPEAVSVVRDPYTNRFELRKELMDELPKPEKLELPPNRHVEESEIDAESWVKYDKTDPEHAAKVTEKVNQYADRGGLSVLQANYLIGMLTAPARAEQHRYRHRGRGFACCAKPDPFVVDRYGRDVSERHEVVRCNNCEAEWDT